MPPGDSPRAVALLDEAGATAPVDLTVAIVSFNDAQWLEPCLASLREHRGDIALEVIVVDNGSDGAGDMVRQRHPDVRVVCTDNHGFGHGNNRAVLAARGRYILFLNPDTELLDGSLDSIVAAMDERPEMGLAGVRQVTADGVLWPTIRCFPGFARAFGDALASERWPRPRRGPGSANST